MFRSLRRIIKTGFVNFWRNGFVSVSSVTVMTITLFVIGSLFFLNAFLETSLTSLKNKVDVNVYFVEDATEEEIRTIQTQLESLPEVAYVTYTSRDEALEAFKSDPRRRQIDLEALEELGDNPLLASLSVKATDPQQYERIVSFLEEDQSTLSTDGTTVIAKTNYRDNQGAIEKLQQVIQGIEMFGLALSSVLVAVSVVIVFNTIRMAIYISREEIAVMRLVGATDAYIRGPFVIEGMMYGVIAAIITLVSFYPIAIWLGPATQQFFGDINLFTYYTSNFGRIFLTVMATGMFLGALSSYLAVKKYLKV